MLDRNVVAVGELGEERLVFTHLVLDTLEKLHHGCVALVARKAILEPLKHLICTSTLVAATEEIRIEAGNPASKWSAQASSKWSAQAS